MNLVGHFKEGTSDKVYIVSIIQVDTGIYNIVGKWGRRGNRLATQMKHKGITSFNVANIFQKQIFGEKISKGYVDIESREYHGPLTMDNTWLKQHLEEDVSTVSVVTDEIIEFPLKMTGEELEKRVVEELKHSFKKAVDLVMDELDILRNFATDYVKEVHNRYNSHTSNFNVVCSSNIGLEEHFDENVIYIAEAHIEPEMLWVFDCNNERIECFASRFETVK